MDDNSMIIITILWLLYWLLLKNDKKWKEVEIAKER